MNSDSDHDAAVPESQKLERRLWLILLASFLAAALVLAAYVLRFQGPLSPDASVWGQFGDYVGGLLNPIFGLLALVGLLLTIALQNRGLEISRRELHNSTTELRNSAEALRAQNESLKKQTFENAFFQLLRFQNEIVNGIDIRGDTADASGLTVGRDCFKVFSEMFSERFARYEAEEALDRITQSWLMFYEENQSDLGHYFRHLYHIIKFVNRSDVEEPRYYTNLVRAQLSSYELLLIFYNCLSPMGREKFKPLIEKYALFKNMPKELVLRREHLGFYAASAYGEEGAA